MPVHTAWTFDPLRCVSEADSCGVSVLGHGLFDSCATGDTAAEQARENIEINGCHASPLGLAFPRTSSE